MLISLFISRDRERCKNSPSHLALEVLTLSLTLRKVIQTSRRRQDPEWTAATINFQEYRTVTRFKWLFRRIYAFVLCPFPDRLILSLHCFNLQVQRDVLQCWGQIDFTFVKTKSFEMPWPSQKWAQSVILQSFCSHFCCHHIFTKWHHTSKWHHKNEINMTSASDIFQS